MADILAMLKKIPAQREEERTSDLGQAFRRRRTELGMTMQSVADAAGLSVGFISQVERGLAVPSLSSLVAIAEALDRPVSEFLDRPASSGATTRNKSRESFSVPGALMSYERLSTTFRGSQLHAVIAHEPPGHRVEPICHRGEELFFMLEGEITIEIEGKREVLRKGDTIHFDSRRVHSTWNHSDRPAVLLWCGTMNVFEDAPAPFHKDASEPETANTYEEE